MIGIDISDRSVKVLQLSNDEQQRLLAHCWHRVPEGVIRRGIVGEEKALRQVLKETLKLCRLENVYIDWQPVDTKRHAVAGRIEVLVGAAQKKVVDPLLNMMLGLGLDVAALELESQAIVRALITPELKGQKGLLVVDLGGTATNVIIHDRGAMRFTASLQRGANDLTSVLSSEDARVLSVPRQGELPADVARKMAVRLRAGEEELVMEIRGVVEFYNGIDSRHEVKEIILTGGGSNFPGLEDVFLRFFDNMHVQRGNPWVKVLPGGQRKKAVLSLRESAHFTTAVGLALRQVDV